MTASWRQAKPGRIAAALAVSQAQNSGGWFVAGQSADVGATESVARTIAGREVVFWRDADGTLVAGPGACPHLGALMDACPVLDGTMYCRWHGLALTSTGDRTWSPYAALDDGLLIWVRLATEGETFTERPAHSARPPLDGSVSAVMVEPGTCEPEDVIANRLDPWHGAWFHPYAFSHLVVDDNASDSSRLVVDVTFRLSRTWGVPVRAEFTCPDTRTIVMRIIDGEGTASVVETHATPTGWTSAADRSRWSPRRPSPTPTGPASRSRSGSPRCCDRDHQDGQEAVGGRPGVRGTALRAADARGVPGLISLLIEGDLTGVMSATKPPQLLVAGVVALVAFRGTTAAESRVDRPGAKCADPVGRARPDSGPS